MPQITLNQMAIDAHENSKRKGFWDGVEPGAQHVIPEKIALIHSEASEALEVYREHPVGGDISTPIYDNAKEGKPIGFDSELADIVIRVGDLAAHLGIDLDRAVAEKMAYNAKRPHMHGKRL